MEPELLTINQACNLLNVSRSKIYELLNDGSIPAHKVGRKTLISRNTLQAWIDRLEPYAIEKGL